MQQSLLDDLLLIDDAQERLALVVDRARATPRFTADERSPVRLVRGCTSPVWLLPRYDAGLCHFRADADSPLVRGLVVLLADYFNHSTPAEILASDTDPLAVLGLSKNLSPTRLHGLAAVRAAIRAFAAAQLAAAG